MPSVILDTEETAPDSQAISNSTALVVHAICRQIGLGIHR